MCAAPSNVLSGYELYMQEHGHNRPRIDELDSHLFPDGGPTPQALVEISGASGSGKSLLIRELIIQCVSPTSLGGKNCQVVFINLSHKFDITVFKHRIYELFKLGTEESSSSSSDDLDKMVEHCLRSVIMLQCHSPDDVELALKRLEFMLLENNTISLLVVDTLCEFYWLDINEKPTSKHNYYAQWVDRLRDLCKKYLVCCMYTVDREFVVNATHLDIDYRLHLQRFPDGKRTLNDKPIIIDDGGLRFRLFIDSL